MIKLQVIGHLGRDGVLKEVNGKNVINFTVAHSERYKDAQGNQKERTTWVDCAYWSEKTGIAPYLLKGQLVYVEGAPEAEGYLNKENQAAATLRLRVSNIQLLGSKNSNDGQAPQASGNNYASNTAPTSSPVAAPSTEASSMSSVGADDLPF